MSTHNEAGCLALQSGEEVTGDSSAAYLTAQLALRDARIAQLESENDALSRRLHLLHSKQCEPATAGNLFWRKYVNGGSSLWRTMFDAVSGGGRLWRVLVRVGRRRA